MRLSLILLTIAMAGCTGQALNQPTVSNAVENGLYTLVQINRAVDSYCAENSNSLLRQAALTVIRTKLPEIPEDGICTNFGIR